MELDSCRHNGLELSRPAVGGEKNAARIIAFPRGSANFVASSVERLGGLSVDKAHDKARVTWESVATLFREKLLVGC